MDFSQIGLIIFNIITPSIPEQIFFIYFTLFLMGKTEQTGLNSKNLRRMLICAAVVSSFAVPLRVYYPALAEQGMLLPIGIIATWISVILAYRISGILNLLKAFVCIILSFVAVTIFQFSYVPLLMYGTKTSLEVVSQLGITSFIWSLPEVVMILTVLSFIAFKKNIYKNINLLMILTRNKVVMTVTIILLVFNIAFLATMCKLIGFDKIIYDLPFISQLLIIAIVIMFPILNVYLLIIVLYSNYYKETIRVMLSKDRLNTLVSILGVYAEERNFEKIDNIVNDIHKQVHYI
ncbi:MAG: hypothetical protein A2Y21_03405 [Clostridiales bacterium GWC2_40_7]|nr:MAG: hypothetical protein A2Y21_03405 [Clostridiales bacterium GWC2_40_7]